MSKGKPWTYTDLLDKEVPRYFWEEGIDGFIYVYLNKMDRDGIIFGRTPPVCQIIEKGSRKAKEIADFIVNALNKTETQRE
jgi:hypothetical protein